MYEFIKDGFSKISNFKSQYISIFILIFLHIYKKLFNQDFIIFKDRIFEFMPNRITMVVDDLSIPLVRLFLFISFMAFILVIILLIAVHLNTKRGWFCSFLNNYIYLFSKSTRIVENLIQYLIIAATNVVIVILLTLNIFDNPKAVEFINNLTYAGIFLVFPALFVITVYFGSILTFFFQKINENVYEYYTKKH